MGYRIYHLDAQGLVEIIVAPADGWTADAIRHRYPGLTPHPEPDDLMGWPDRSVYWHDWDGCGQIGLKQPITEMPDDHHQRSTQQ